MKLFEACIFIHSLQFIFSCCQDDFNYFRHTLKMIVFVTIVEVEFDIQSIVECYALMMREIIFY